MGVVVCMVVVVVFDCIALDGLVVNILVVGDIVPAFIAVTVAFLDKLPRDSVGV